MKKKPLICAFAAFLIGCLGAFAGCSVLTNSAATDPYSAIKQAYGTQQFTISFNSENLAEPIEDMTYTAYNIPKLPTPRRVGYVFDGWFFDSNYQTQYFDNVLYLYMRDVTLYAKWVKEELVQNGVYDVQASLTVVDGSLKEYSLSQKYGNTPELFLSAVNMDAIQLEKTDGDLLLKFEYDIKTTKTFAALAETFSVTVNSSMGSSVYVKDKIAPANETTRTLYFNINNISLEDPILLNVMAYNWDAEVGEGESVDDTRISFTVSLQITEFEGFSTAFADYTVKLEDGYYSVKTYYEADSETGTEMIAGYNPVYSYLYAKDGHYTLIKPFTPYTGLVGSGINYDYYYDVLATFITPQYYWELLPSGESYSAGTYKTVTAEFHADTGRNYYLFDLGDSVQKQLRMNCTVSGIMERFFHSGTMNLNIVIDYEHMISVSDTGYTPLSGDYMQFTDEVKVAGSEQEDSLGKVIAAGLQYDYVNFFYSVTNETKTMLSHSVTVMPTSSLNVGELADGVTAFTRNFKVYGYDFSSDALYENCLAANDSASMWENRQLKVGKLIDKGDTVSLAALYHEKVEKDGDFSKVSAQAYYITDDTVNYSRPYAITDSSFVFSADVAVVFTVNGESGTGSTVVELRSNVPPELEFLDDFEYDDGKTVRTDNQTHLYARGSFSYGQTIAYPNLFYQWYGASGNFLDEYFDINEGEICIHPVYTKMYSVDDEGNYSLLTMKYGNDIDTSLFFMNADHVAIVYELLNVYGERHYVVVHYTTAGQTYYSLERNGEEVQTGRVSYTNGLRDTVAVKEEYVITLTSYQEFKNIFNNSYAFVIDGESFETVLSSAKVYTRAGYQELAFPSGEQVISLVGEEDYVYLSLTYANGDDYYRIMYMYGVKFDGAFEFKPIPYEAVFTDTTYTFRVPYITSSDGIKLGSGTISLFRVESSSNSHELVENGENYTLKFNKTGTYRFSYYVIFKYDENGNRVFGNIRSLTVRFTQTVTVISGTTSVVQITYTDTQKHPFLESYSTDGSYTVTYNVKDLINLLDASYFKNESGANLLAWAVRQEYTYLDTSVILYTEEILRTFITTFHAQNVTLYPIWDEKINVTLSLVMESGGEETVFNPNAKSQIFALEKKSSSYRISISDYCLFTAENNVPSGYVLAGFRGGFLGDNLIPLDDIPLYSYAYAPDYYSGLQDPYTVYAVYKKQVNVSFELNAVYTKSYFAKETIFEGDSVAEKTVTTRSDAYTFVGWVLKNEAQEYSEEDVITRISGYAVPNDTIFVAVFKDAEGNLVW